MFAVEVESTEGMNLREGELSRRIALLEQQLTGFKKKFRKSGQNYKRFVIFCYNCGKIGHVAKNCQGGCKKSNDPKAGSDSKRLRQANQQGKAGQIRCGGF